MPKNIQIAISNRVDNILNEQIKFDQFCEIMNEKICELQSRITSVLPEKHKGLISELDSLHTEYDSYCIHKAYRIGLTDGMNIEGGSI